MRQERTVGNRLAESTAAVRITAEGITRKFRITGIIMLPGRVPNISRYVAHRTLALY